MYEESKVKEGMRGETSIRKERREEWEKEKWKGDKIKEKEASQEKEEGEERKEE